MTLFYITRASREEEAGRFATRCQRAEHACLQRGARERAISRVRFRRGIEIGASIGDFSAADLFESVGENRRRASSIAATNARASLHQ